MPRPTPDTRGPIARKLVQAVRRAGRVAASEFSALLKMPEEGLFADDAEPNLDGYDPSHRVYVEAHRRLKLMIELAATFPATRHLAEAIDDAAEEYMPSGPPMSPLTGSYFFFWSLCDLSPAGDGETFASAALDLVRALNGPPDGVDPWATMAALEGSRMGLWVHEGVDDDRVVLRELVTQDVKRCVVPSGYRGSAGEVWYARVLPPGAPGLEPVLMTTPYVLIETTSAHWQAYIDRTLAQFPSHEPRKVYELLMKYGANPRYWPEYVFEAYVNHQHDAVFLTGFPDMAESRPHSRVNRWRDLSSD